jgi:hypothetical protein
MGGSAFFVRFKIGHQAFPDMFAGQCAIDIEESSFHSINSSEKI